MSRIVLDAIDAEIALLAREISTPSGELGYGTDLSCVSDLAEDLAEVDPFSTRAIGEAALRRLTTARGTLPDDPDYGLDVRSYANRGVALQELRDLAGLTQAELLKDDRLVDAAVTVTQPGQGELSVDVMLTPADARLAPFALIFAVSGGLIVVEAIG